MALDFLRQLGASTGRHAGYRLRRCPVRLPDGRGGRVDGPARRDGPSRGWLDGPDGGLEVFDRGLPSVGRGGGNLLTPAFAFTRENTPGRPPLVLEPDGRGRRSSFVGPRAGAGLDGDVRTTMVGTDYAKGPSARWASSSSRTCAAIRLALGDQDLRLAQVADNLLRGITFSGHDDPFLVTQFLTTELDTIQGGQVIAPSLSFTFPLLLAKRRFSEHLLILAAGEANENSRDHFPERR